mgnify:CR=1 FL=1
MYVWPVLLEQYTTFTKMAQDASNVFDSLDNRYEAYAQAEAYLLDHALVIPCHHSISWQLTKVNDYSKMYAMFGRFNGAGARRPPAGRWRCMSGC